MSRFFVMSFLFLGMLFLLVPVFRVLAVTTCPTNFELKAGVCFPAASTTGLSGMSVYDLLTTVMNWLLGIIGVLAVIAFIISGVQYLVSAGDEDMAETAKRNMTYALIGLAIALAGLIIVNAVAGLMGARGVTAY
ncbi:MAG: pilin [Candidatus Moraniibacteriota bacterium]